MSSCLTACVQYDEFNAIIEHFGNLTCRELDEKMDPTLMSVQNEAGTRRTIDNNKMLRLAVAGYLS